VTGPVEGAPDLVIEVLSTSTARHDRTRKLQWYRSYGVRECWLVDPVHGSIEVTDFTLEGPPTCHVETEPVRSRVLPALVLSADDVLRPVGTRSC
jgi:Uma2 family endonuclease